MRAVFWLIPSFKGWPVWLSTAVWIVPSVCQISTFSLLILFLAKLAQKNEWREKKNAFITVYVVVNTVMIMITILISGLTDVESRISACSEEKQSSQVDDDCVDNGSFNFLNSMYFTTSGIYFGCLVLLAAWYVYKLRHMLWDERSRSLVSLDPSHIRLKESWRNPGARHWILLSMAAVFFIFGSRCFYDSMAASNRIFSNLYIRHMNGNKKSISLGGFLLLVLWEVIPSVLVLAYCHHIPASRISPFLRWKRFLFGHAANREKNQFASYDEPYPEDNSSDLECYSGPDAFEYLKIDGENAQEFCFSALHISPFDNSECKSPESGIRIMPIPNVRKERFYDPRRYDSDTESQWRPPGGAESTDSTLCDAISFEPLPQLVFPHNVGLHSVGSSLKRRDN